jgi:class 3 adenylate cyclase
MHNESPSSDGQAPIERRLATILMADVFGYSKMMGENEEQTVRIFRGHRAVFGELLQAHRGRVFNTAGDAILAEFPSAVEAVRCATEIQTALRTRNEHLPEGQRMWFRIGINLGDVIVQGDDLLGDGVNVAARIQTIAEPGGVCISGSVYDQIQNKLTLQIRQLGEKSFKNIAQPVRTFSISDEAGGTAAARWRPSRRVPVALTLGGLVALTAAAGVGYWIYRDHDLRVADEGRRAQETQRAADAQRKAEQDREAAAADKQAKLQAELASAKDALAQAEASKRKAEMDRASAELAQREAKVQADLKAAKDALQKAGESEKKAEQDRLAATAAMKSAEAASAMKAAEAATATKGAETGSRKGAAADRVATTAGRATSAQKGEAATRSASAAGGKGVDRLDGTYAGRMCSVNPDGSPRCWKVELTALHGALSASWTSRSNQTSTASGTIADDGSVSLALTGYNVKGHPISADARGSLSDNRITVSGTWSNGVPVNATWALNR